MCMPGYSNGSGQLLDEAGKVQKLKILQRDRTVQRSPKLRTTPPPPRTTPAKLYFPTSICEQFPANRFGGLSGIFSTHT